MCSALVLHTVDPSLGRASIHTFSQQTLMELLVADFPDSTKQAFQTSGRDFVDACDWHAVVCDDSASVVNIAWNDMDLSAKIDIRCLPQTLRSFDASRNALRCKGEIQFGLLPENLQRLSLDDNLMGGGADFSDIPAALTDIRMCRNVLAGTLRLLFPVSIIESIRVRDNALRGSVSLQNLPDSLVILDLAQNFLSGEICLGKLPQGIFEIFLQSNRLTGTVRLHALPQSLSLVDLGENGFSGIVVGELPDELFRVYLTRNAIRSVVDVDGTEVTDVGSISEKIEVEFGDVA